jgi:uncharacterized membrane protein
MFGIRGLDSFGFVHALIGIAALLFGLAVLLAAKGTRQHRKLGYAYVASMLALNVTALMIYDLYGRFGPFHVLALISLATLIAGFVPAYRRRPLHDWVEIHAITLSWSYVGLVAAFFSEIIVRIPRAPFWPAIGVATALTMIGGAVLIHTRVPRIVLTWRNRPLRSPAAL